MVVIVASALIETLTKHMFQKYLDAKDKIEIGGAPSWYMKEVEDQMCVFAHSKGGMNSIEISKNKAKIKMIKKINGLIDVVVYDNIKNIKNQKEKKMVNKWKKDPNLPVFTAKNLNYSRIAYEDEIDTTFVRACIPKQIVFLYEKERLFNIQKSLVKFKSSSAIEELDAAIGGKSGDRGDANDPFSELDKQDFK